MAKVVDWKVWPEPCAMRFEAPWQKQIKALREALPRGDLDGPRWDFG